MLMRMTKAHRRLLLHIMEVMQPFYGIKFMPMCKEIGEETGASEKDVNEAVRILSESHAICRIPEKVDAIKKFRQDLEHIKDKRGEKYPYSMDVEREQLYLITAVVNTYSRMLMGQIFYLFEELDIYNDEKKKKNTEAMQEWDLCRWSGGSALQAKNLLFPDLAEKGIAWKEGYIVTSDMVSDNCRLAYEIREAMEDALYKEHEYGLAMITGEPLMKVSYQ